MLIINKLIRQALHLPLCDFLLSQLPQVAFNTITDAELKRANLPYFIMLQSFYNVKFSIN